MQFVKLHDSLSLNDSDDSLELQSSLENELNNAIHEIKKLDVEFSEKEKKLKDDKSDLKHKIVVLEDTVKSLYENENTLKRELTRLKSFCSEKSDNQFNNEYNELLEIQNTLEE